MIRILPRWRWLEATHDGEVLAARLPCAARPPFQEVDLHRQLANLALELGDLGLILSDARGVSDFIVEVTGFALLDPQPDPAPFVA